MTASLALRSAEATALRRNYVAIGEVWMWQFIGDLVLMDGTWAAPPAHTPTVSRPRQRLEQTRGGGVED